MKLMLWLWWPQPWDHTENCNKLFRLICEKKILVGFCLFLILLGGGIACVFVRQNLAVLPRLVLNS